MSDLIKRQDALDALKARAEKSENHAVVAGILMSMNDIKHLPSADASLMQDRCKIDASSDLISRQDAIDAMHVLTDSICEGMAIDVLSELPSIEPLTDIEQRIFLKAISREEEVCRKVDAEWGEGDYECEINLVHTCHEIVRKVKGALWT